MGQLLGALFKQLFYSTTELVPLFHTKNEFWIQTWPAQTSLPQSV